MFEYWVPLKQKKPIRIEFFWKNGRFFSIGLLKNAEFFFVSVMYNKDFCILCSFIQKGCTLGHVHK